MRFLTFVTIICLFAAVGFATPGHAAIKCKGEVAKNDGETLVVILDGKCKLKPGVRVQIKGKKQRKTIEGC